MSNPIHQDTSKRKPNYDESTIGTRTGTKTCVSILQSAEAQIQSRQLVV
jgi:hypothetical protein